ncbi:MAG: DUF488 domain-containing protein [Pseudomonadota bacterium]|nr:DUF488 domain-containing protein [Pseudomonadota bacterium]
MRIFTIGYEGLDLSTFTTLLARHGVETVVDIRELPLSRKKGFSKQALKHELQLAGFGYVHVGALGCPRPVRDGYRQHRDWAIYTEGFMQHLGSQEAALREVAELAKVTTCALLCYEADYNFCHRSMVAEALRQQGQGGLEVEHITAAKDADRNLALF